MVTARPTQLTRLPVVGAEPKSSFMSLGVCCTVTALLEGSDFVTSLLYGLAWFYLCFLISYRYLIVITSHDCV